MLMSRSFKLIASLMLLLEEVGQHVCEMWKHGGSVVVAWRVFNKMPSQNVVSWNVIIIGFVKHG